MMLPYWAKTGQDLSGDGERFHARLIGATDLATVLAQEPPPDQMLLHFGKIGAAIAIVTVAAFVLWLLATTFFATEQAEEEAEQTGAVTLSAGTYA